MEYKVEITETLQHSVLILADDVDQTIQKVERMYKEAEIILDTTDYISTTFTAE